jgi:hypothetical protein
MYECTYDENHISLGLHLQCLFDETRRTFIVYFSPIMNTLKRIEIFSTSFFSAETSRVSVCIVRTWFFVFTTPFHVSIDKYKYSMNPLHAQLGVVAVPCLEPENPVALCSSNENDDGQSCFSVHAFMSGVLWYRLTLDID